ncbi:MAG: mechanosensitive ion channel [Coriobacteriales bacterium]|nr:mechanosensitive ion channel [Coriobacteriales bacterium]
MFERRHLYKLLFLIAVVVITYIIQRFAAKAVRRVLKTGNVPKGSIFVNLVRVLIWSFALLMVLEPVFGIQPTAFVAALGVSSVIVSFGLQTTISNVISGLGLMLGHVIKVGDWIEVGGYQGVVTDITWRATTIKALIGDVIVIPNSVLNTTTLRKLAPLSARAVTISLDVYPQANMVEVEREVRSLVEVATKTWRDPRLPIDLIQQGYGPFGFRLDIRVPLVTMDDAFNARSAIVGACSGKTWLAHW